MERLDELAALFTGLEGEGSTRRMKVVERKYLRSYELDLASSLHFDIEVVCFQLSGTALTSAIEM